MNLNRYAVSALLLMLPALATLAGCSGKGDDVVDPGSSDRKEVAMIAVDKGNESELWRYNEATASTIQNEYQTVNGEPLGREIDAIYEAYEKIYLHHRASGEITVLELKTRKKLAVITGFPSGNDGMLCGMAFSNQSDVWVICHGSNNLYHIDGKALKLVRAIELPGNPTAIGTSGTRIFVGLVMPDGASKAAVLSSTGGVAYPVEHLLSFPTPVIYAVGTPDGEQMALLTAGDPGADPTLPDDDVRPMIHYVLLSTMAVDAEAPIEAPALTEYIGEEPTFVAYTREFLLYLAAPNGVTLVDTRGRAVIPAWLPGAFRVLAVDPFTSFMYVHDAAQGVIRRFGPDGAEYEPLVLGDPVRAMVFVNSNKTQ